MKKIILTTLLFFILAFNTFTLLSADWSPVGGAGISTGMAFEPSLQVVNSNEIYVAYRDNGNGDKAIVMKWNGIVWSTVGGGSISAGATEYTSLQVVNGNEMYLSYIDRSNEGKKATVMKWNGSTWAPVGGGGIEGSFVEYLAMQVVNGNEIYLAYTDKNNNNKATVMKWNGSTWAPVGSGGISVGIASDISLHLVSGNEIYMSYIDIGNGSKAIVMKWNGSTWAPVGGGSISAGGAYTPSLQVISGNEIYLAYCDFTNGYKTTVMKWNGSTWAPVVGGNIYTGEFGQADLQVVNANEIYLADCDDANNQSLAVLEWNGSAWSPVGVNDISPWGYYPSLQVVNGGIYVAFQDQSGMISGKLTVLKWTGSGSSGSNPYTFLRNGSMVTYTRLNTAAQNISSIIFDEAALGLSGLTAESLQPMVTMRKAGEGKLYLNVVGSLADAVNTRNGTVWVTANFATDRIRPVVMNGVQISDSKGHVFPGYASYIDNISFSAGILTFRIKHFTEYGIPALEAKTFADSGAGLNINALGANIIAQVPGNSFAGTSLQNTTTSVAKISGLAYETVLSDVPSTVNNLYKPLTPGTEYGISFEYINRGNATDTANINLVLTTANAGHFGYSITTDTKAVAPWQVVSFDVKVNANNANAFERATLNATVALPEASAVSYNAFVNAYLGGSFAGDGAYGGVENLNHMFILEAEGYNVSVLNRTVTINVPAGYTGSPGDMVPGSKVIYSIAIKNNSTAAATSVNVSDQIANNCHLYYTDAPTVEGATAWEWKGMTNNNATSADTGAVNFEITIPASSIVTASYTVTLD